MRQRKLKDLDEKLTEFNGGIKINPKALKGRWQEMFAEEQPLYMELGCGKGQFIRKKALDNPDKDYIAIEGQDTACFVTASAPLPQSHTFSSAL